MSESDIGVLSVTCEPKAGELKSHQNVDIYVQFSFHTLVSFFDTPFQRVLCNLTVFFLSEVFIYSTGVFSFSFIFGIMNTKLSAYLCYFFTSFSQFFSVFGICSFLYIFLLF